MRPIINCKVRRLDGRNYRPKVLDLFAGCGGLSLGFQSAGFEIVAAVENDATAAKTHARNFFANSSQEERNRHAQPRDVTDIEPEELLEEFGFDAPDRAIDVIIGGPPCQAYSRIGRAKLREVADHPEAYRVDPRANLYLRYLHYIDRLKPLAILMENVPDIMNCGGANIAEEITEALDALGYCARYTLINSVHHGVPQMRDRVFLIAFRKEFRTTAIFPTNSHSFQLPAGYRGQRAVALKLVDMLSGQGYSEAPYLPKDLPSAISAKQALSDLPSITNSRRCNQTFDQLARYRSSRPSDYARAMRSWPGFENPDGVLDHVVRCLPRDTPIFAAMEHGSEYPAARELAIALLKEQAAKQSITPNSPAWVSLERAMVPPYDPTKFKNRWWKLEPDGPVRTLTAHIGKDTYTHIHYDDDQGRVISVREAARLQSFPDGFRFCGAMNSAYKQIGNAVPPLMSKRLAENIMGQLRDIAKCFTRDPPKVAAE